MNGEISAEVSAPQESWKLLGALTTAHGVNDFYALLLPFLLPTIIETFNLDFAGAGILAFVTSMFSNILQPVVGHFADVRQIRKPIMMAGFVAFIVGLIVASTAASFPVLLLAFLIFGLGQTTYHPQATNFLTNAFKGNKGRAMGIHGIGGSLGNFCAPLLVTTLLTFFAFRTSLYVLIIPGVVIIAAIALTLKEMPPSGREAGKFKISADLVLLSACFGFIFMAFRGFLTFLPTYLVSTGSTLSQAGQISALMLLIGFLAQPIGGTIFDRIGGFKVLAVSAILTSLSIWLFIQSAWPSPFFYVVVVGAAVTATFPVGLTMASELAQDGNVGIAVGAMFGISGMMSAITQPVIGFLADSVGLENAFLALVLFPLIGLVLSLKLRKYDK